MSKPSLASHATVKSKVDEPLLIERRRAQFVDAAITLFGRKGYHATTIREIAVAAKVSIGLIYQYVEDKEDILLLALTTVLDIYRREIPVALEGKTEPLERFLTAVDIYCRIIDQNVSATVLAYRETKSLRPERRALIQQKEVETNALVADCINQCIHVGLFDKNVDVELLTYQIVMFAHAWALKSWYFRPLMTVDAYVVRGLNLILGSVLTPSGQRAFLKAT
jgi:AcrR family transcriptional regulator